MDQEETKQDQPNESESQKEIENLLEGMKLKFIEPQTETDQAKTSDEIPLATPFLLMVAGMFLIEGWMMRKE